MSELTAHISLFQFLAIATPKLPDLAFVWHTRNENADEQERKRGGQLGVIPGVWDILFIGGNQQPIEGVAMFLFAGVAIELKSTRAYRTPHQGLSDAQIVWRQHYIKHGWYTAVYPEQGWPNAARLLIRWVGGDVNDFTFG